MKNMENIEIYRDMYNIYNLITKINDGYRLYFDKKHKNFLVINIKNRNEICLKFEAFSSDILKQLQKTQIHNCQKLFKEIDNKNEEKRLSYQNKTKNLLTSKIEDLVKYSSRTNKILQSDINKIIEVKNA